MPFIQVSGDLTNNATDAEFNTYKAATAQSEVPVWPAVGNHEYSAGSTYADRINNYRNHVGPEWYSFDYGNRHFLVLENNGAAPFDEQLTWVKADLAQNVGDKKLVVLTHQPMNVPFGSNAVYDQYGDLLERYGAELILVGHEHSNDVEPDSDFAGTAKHVQTSSSSYTIDNAPRGFRYVSMTDESFQNPFRMYGAEQDLTITSPADGTAVPLAGFPGIQVNAYDTADAPTDVEFRMDGGNWRPLKATGEFTWHSPLQGDLRTVGRHDVEVRATDAAGDTWTESATFTLTKEAAIVPTAGADWEQHHGDAGHTGVAADEIEAGQRLAWSYRTEGTFLTGSPAIVDGVVYAGTRDENGDGNSAVHAVDQATGKALWTYDVPSSVHGSIAVSDGKVFVPTLRGTLFAVDATTGELAWQHDPQAAPAPYNQRTYGYYGVTVADGKVLYPYQTRHGEATSGLLVALDVATGERAWAAPMSGSTMSDGTPAVADGRVYVGNQTADQVIAYDLETGRRLWIGAAQLGGWQDGIPSAADGRVFIGSNNGIIARDGATGQTLWTYRSPQASLVNGGATPAAATIAGDVVYMGFPSGAVAALDAATGAVLWNRLLPGEQYHGGIHTSPALSGDTLFVGSNNGSFYALDARTGQPLWEHEIGTWVTAGPAISGNTVVVGALDGNLYAYTPGGAAADPWPVVTGTVSKNGSPGRRRQCLRGARRQDRRLLDHRPRRQLRDGARGRGRDLHHPVGQPRLHERAAGGERRGRRVRRCRPLRHSGDRGRQRREAAGGWSRRGRAGRHRHGEPAPGDVGGQGLQRPADEPVDRREGAGHGPVRQAGPAGLDQPALRELDPAHGWQRLAAAPGPLGLGGDRGEQRGARRRRGHRHLSGAPRARGGHHLHGDPGRPVDHRQVGLHEHHRPGASGLGGRRARPRRCGLAQWCRGPPGDHLRSSGVHPGRGSLDRAVGHRRLAADLRPALHAGTAATSRRTAQRSGT